MRNVMATSLVAILAAAAAAAQPSFEPLPPIETVEIRDGVMHVNGEVFIPIIAWGQPERNFGRLRDLGFNVFGASGEWARDASEYGQWARRVGAYAAGEFREHDEAALTHPRFVAWFQDDEPDMPRRAEQAATPDDLEARPEHVEGYQPKIPADEIIARYEQIKQADPMRPVWMTFTGHFSTLIPSRYTPEQRAELYPAYVPGADMLGFDIYPIYGHGRPAWLNVPPNALKELIELADGRPVFAWIETAKGSQWMTYERQPDVLPVHTRFQVFGALINGAVGIGYFTHVWQPEFDEFGPTDEMQDELARIADQINRLGPAIVAPETDLAVDVSMSDGLSSRFRATEHDGDLYIFAQITDLGPDAADAGQFDPIHPRPGRATITVPGLEAGTEIEVIDQDRTITASDGYFVDDFEPLSDRFYRMPRPQ